MQLISFFRKKHPEFVQVPLVEIPENTIEITLENKQYKATYFHLLYEPQLIGITIPESLTAEQVSPIKTITINKFHKIKLEWTVNFNATINLGAQTILLFEVVNADLKTNFWERLYIRRFFKRAIIKNNYVINTFNTRVFDKMISFFYYPKPVYIVSTAATAGENAFPVDTCRQVGTLFIFGVRTSNQKMQQVNIGDTMVMGLSEFSKKHLIYQLGNYSTENREIDYTMDPNYGIAVPNIVSKYYSVRLTQIHSYDSQKVYVAQSIAGEKTLSPSPFLAHIHKFWLLPKRK